MRRLAGIERRFLASPGIKRGNGRSSIAFALLSFRMISDTRIECQNANSQRETTWFGPSSTDWGGAEPGSPGSVGLDGFLSSLPQRGLYLPSLWHQPPD